MKHYKIVLLPIYVPKGNYCVTDSKTCDNFKVKDYHCEYRSSVLKVTPGGKVKKPKECLALKEGK